MKKHLLHFAMLAFALLLHCTVSAQVNGGKKILIVTTNSDKDLKYGTDGWGCYFPEIVDFYSKIKKHGFTLDDIDFVSLKGGSIPLFEDPFRLPITADEEQKIRARVKNTLKPSDINPDKYNVIYYAGGISCLVDFPSSATIGVLAQSIYEKGGVVAAVCDGISGLTPIMLSNGKPLVEGVKVTTNVYTPDHGIDVADELKKKGGMVDQSKGVVVDKRVVTGRNVRPVEVATEVLKLLNMQFPTAIEEQPLTSAATVYPNPASTTLYVSIPDGTSTNYTICNMAGQTVQQGNITGGRIDVSSIQQGQYIISTGAGNSSVITVQH
jgi:putative intracellular protease/amidase